MPTFDASITDTDVIPAVLSMKTPITATPLFLMGEEVVVIDMATTTTTWFRTVSCNRFQPKKEKKTFQKS